MKKEFLSYLGFTLKDNSIGVYFKKYHDNSIIEVDFEKGEINYLNIECESKTTSNFSQAENFVVLECVNRLLEKGYFAKDIVLEKTYKLGHQNKGRLDILVKKDGKTFLMIECKTYGKEFDKELKNIQKDGGQIFSYFQQDRDAEFIMLYASNFNGKEIEYKNEIIKIEESYRETSNVKDFFDRWNKFTKQNGIFDSWVLAYDFESKALTYDKLNDIKEQDASIIFNRFLEILRHNTVSDKPNAFNKMFTLFLCKIYDELDKDGKVDENGSPIELEFQWIEGKDDNISFQKKLTDLYKKGMDEFLKKQVTDFSDEDFEKQFGNLIKDQDEKQKLLNHITKLRLQKNNEFAIKEVFDDASFEENAKVLKEVVQLLERYKLRYSKKQPFLGDFFELLLTTGLKQEAGQFFTPVPIARFICKSIPIEKIIDKKINSGENHDILPSIIDYAAGSGHFIIESMEEIQNIINNKNLDNYNSNIKKQFGIWKLDPYLWAKDYAYGIEKDYRLVRTSKVGCYLHGDGIATVIHGDGLDSFENSSDYRLKLKVFDKNDKQENAQFDLVLSNPPYSVSAFKGNLKKENAENDFELFKNLTDNSSEIEALFIERTKQLLKEGGIAAIILPSSILSNTGIYTKAREIILKNFEIISIVSLGSNTFMATGTNTVVLFMRKRDKFIAVKLEKQIDDLYRNLIDVSLNNIENVFSKYVNYVWEGLSFEDYKTLILKKPNEKVLNHEIFKEYSKKLKLDKKQDLFDEIIKIEKDKMFYFVLSYSQNVVLVKSGEKQAEKEFLGYEFSFRKGSEGIHPIQGGKLIDECTKLFDPETLDNPEKVSTYIYDGFNGDFSREISEDLQDNIFRAKLVDLFTFDRFEFLKIISTNIKKKIIIESKYEQVKIESVLLEIKNGKNVNQIDQVGKYRVSRIESIANAEFNINATKWTNDNVEEMDFLKKGDILFSHINSPWYLGKTGIFDLDENVIHGVNLLRLRSNLDLVLPKYIYQILRTKDFISEVQKYAIKAANQASVNVSSIQNLKIPLPPKNIQEKIVSEIEVLEKEELEKKEKVEVLKSEIENIVGGIYGDKTNLGDLINLHDSKRIPLGSRERVKGEYPYYGATGIIDYVDKYIFDGKYILIGEDGAKWGKNEKSAFFAEGKFWVNNHAHIFQTNEKTIDKYIVEILNLLDLSEYITGANVPKLTQGNLLNIKIPLPSLEIQKQIIQKIEKIESEIEILENDLKQIPEKKKEVLRKYL